MLFVSHASQDRSAIDGLLAVLRRTGREVWLDDELGGGEAWWQSILEKIRDSKVFIIALSNNALASKPCAAELRYAQALRRPILPVQIGSVDSVRVTPLAATHIIDFRNPFPDNEIRLLAAVQKCRAQCGPLPEVLPEEPEVPFAYLMRMASVLSHPALSHHDQAGLVLELRHKLAEDCADPAALRDIVRLLYLLRDRPDVTWRIRGEVDALLSACDANLSAPIGLTTVPFSSPRLVESPAEQISVERPRSSRGSTESSPAEPGSDIALPASSDTIDSGESTATRARPVVIAASSSRIAEAGRTGLAHSRWILGSAVGLAVLATVVVAVLHSQQDPKGPDVDLLEDSTLNTIMGTAGMTTAEGGVRKAKHIKGEIEVSPPECASVLYPGLDRAYRDSGGGKPTWRVSEDRGGMARAGLDNNFFVDQDVTAFPPETDRPEAFVRASALPWKACAGQTVSAAYRGGETYTWQVGEVVGDVPQIAQTFTRVGGERYTCQRVMRVVNDLVLDIKACGDRVDDEASKIAGRLAAALMDESPF